MKRKIISMLAVFTEVMAITAGAGSVKAFAAEATFLDQRGGCVAILRSG